MKTQTKTTKIMATTLLILMAIGALTSAAQASGRVVYDVQVRPNGIIASFDNTLDAPNGILVGYREMLVIRGKVVAGTLKPAHMRMSMGETKQFPLRYAAPSRQTLRGRGEYVVEFYFNEKHVYTAVFPFANGQWLKNRDGYTINAQ